MSQGKLFDGFPICNYEGKFAGTFEMDEDLAEDLRFDDVVTFVVTGRISGVNLGETKTGDIKRVNAFQVVSSAALDPQTATKVLNSLGQMVPGVNAGQLTLGQTPPTATLDDDDEPDDLVPVGPQPIATSDKALADFLSE